MKQQKKISIGIIGYGFRGRGVTENILESGLFEVDSICDINAESKASVKTHPILNQTYFTTDYRHILNRSSAEAVFIMSPQYTHHQITCEAFRAGKSVYCEKPMALSLKECDQMIAEGRKAGRVLMIGQQMRYHAHLNQMKSLISDGVVGDPVMIWLKEFRNPFPSSMLWAFDASKSGGLLVEKNCHHFDFFNWMAGSTPCRVYASGGQNVIRKPFGLESNILDNAWVIVDYKNGVRASLGICMFGGLPYKYECGVGMHMREMGVMGAKGMIRSEGYDLGGNLEVRFSESRNRVFHEIRNDGVIPTPYNGSGNHGILLRFHECVLTGALPEASGEIGKAALAVSLAAEKSVVEGRPIELDE